MRMFKYHRTIPSLLMWICKEVSHHFCFGGTLKPLRRITALLHLGSLSYKHGQVLLHLLAQHSLNHLTEIDLQENGGQMLFLSSTCAYILLGRVQLGYGKHGSVRGTSWAVGVLRLFVCTLEEEVWLVSKHQHLRQNVLVHDLMLQGRTVLSPMSGGR